MEATTFLQRFTDKAVWITLIAVFVLGILADHYVLSPTPNYGRDTVLVEVKPPPGSTTTGIPAVVPPKIVYRDRIDSTALWESAWLQNENATLKDQLDSLTADKDSLRARLDVLLAPHVATTTFHFDLLEGKGYMDGTAEQGYLPMKQQFGLSLQPTKLVLPEITITKRPAWWVKPAMFLGGASTAYFIGEKNSTGALVSGGVSTLILFVEF